MQSDAIARRAIGRARGWTPPARPETGMRVPPDAGAARPERDRARPA